MFCTTWNKKYFLAVFQIDTYCNKWVPKHFVMRMSDFFLVVPKHLMVAVMRMSDLFLPVGLYTSSCQMYTLCFFLLCIFYSELCLPFWFTAFKKTEPIARALRSSLWKSNQCNNWQISILKISIKFYCGILWFIYYYWFI